MDNECSQQNFTSEYQNIKINHYICLTLTELSSYLYFFCHHFDIVYLPINELRIILAFFYSPRTHICGKKTHSEKFKREKKYPRRSACLTFNNPSTDFFPYQMRVCMRFCMLTFRTVYALYAYIVIIFSLS